MPFSPSPHHTLPHLISLSPHLTSPHLTFTSPPNFHHHSEVSNMFSVAYAVYLGAKLVFGSISDRVGGKVLIAVTMIGAPASAALFTLGHTFLSFTLLWLLLRCTLAAAWIGTVRVAANWVPPQSSAKYLSSLSLAFIAGDAFSRFVLGAIQSDDMPWRHLFYVAAFIAIGLGLPGLLLIKEHPSNPVDVAISKGKTPLDTDPTDATDKDEQPCLLRPSLQPQGSSPGVTPDDRRETGEGGADAGVEADEDHVALILESHRSSGPSSPSGRRASATARLSRVVKASGFWQVGVLSLLCTGVRETIMSFSAGWFEAWGASDSTSSMMSGLFSGAGVCSVIFLGWFVDRYPNRRGFIFLVMMVPLTGALAALAIIPTSHMKVWLAGVLLVIIGVGLLGPYSLLAGAFAVDIGGPLDSGLVCGLTDALGYLGAIIMMQVHGHVGQMDLFKVLLGFAGCALLTAVSLHREWGTQRQQQRQRQQHAPTAVVTASDPPSPSAGTATAY